MIQAVVVCKPFFIILINGLLIFRFKKNLRSPSLQDYLPLRPHKRSVREIKFEFVQHFFHNFIPNVAFENAAHIV